MVYFIRILLSFVGCLSVVSAEFVLNEEHSTGFNSTFKLSDSQIRNANLSVSIARNIEIAVRHDRTELANGGCFTDAFYNLPPLRDNTIPPPGTLLKVQEYTDPSAFAIPPNTALSRILYTTTNLNGTTVPAAAFIAWPFQPRLFTQDAEPDTGRAPVVLWAHGTSGYFAPSGPSMLRSLWYGDETISPLVLQGYAVVAPDYAGLGIDKSWDGSNIPHQYLASTASAHDALYALRSAHIAFPERLRHDFVIMGHSQGGGVAWRTAEVLHEEANKFLDLVTGHRGTISGSPTTQIFTGLPQLILPSTALAIKNIFRSFKYSDWLTPLGEARLKLFSDIKGSVSVLMQLFLVDGADVIKSSAITSWYARQYQNLSSAGIKPFSQPMLVIQGTNDSYIPFNVTTRTFEDTCSAFPANNLELHVIEGVGHVPSLYASRQYWLQWIQDRFEKKHVQQKGCFRTASKSWLPIDKYLQKGTSYPLWSGLPSFQYELVLAL